MKKVHSLALACLTLASTFSANLHAGTVAGSASLSLGGGFEFFADKRHLNDTAFPLVMVGYNVTNQFGAEMLFGGTDTTFKPGYKPSHKDTEFGLWTIDGVYRFTNLSFLSRYLNHLPPIEPYVMAGFGITHLNPNRFDANDEGNVNAGIGAQFFFHPLIAFRFDARDIYTIVGGKNDVVLDAGITFLFGGC